MEIITQTNRLIIREFSPDEAPIFLDLMTDTRLTAYLPKRNKEQIIDLFNETLTAYKAGNKLTRWGIFDADDLRFIGMCLLKYEKDDQLKAELGYVVHDQFKGRGVATELSIALVNYGFADMELTDIFAVTSPENIPSQKVLLRAGLTQGPNIERYGMELSYFKITAVEWLNAQTR